MTITGFYVIQDATDEWAQVKTQRGDGWVAAYYYGGKRLLQWDETDEVCYPPYITIERGGK